MKRRALFGWVAALCVPILSGAGKAYAWGVSERRHASSLLARWNALMLRPRVAAEAVSFPPVEEARTIVRVGASYPEGVKVVTVSKHVCTPGPKWDAATKQMVGDYCSCFYKRNAYLERIQPSLKRDTSNLLADAIIAEGKIVYVML